MPLHLQHFAFPPLIEQTTPSGSHFTTLQFFLPRQTLSHAIMRTCARLMKTAVRRTSRTEKTKHQFWSLVLSIVHKAAILLVKATGLRGEKETIQRG